MALQICYVSGVTLHVDIPYPAFPDNLGHWAELMLPTYSVLHESSWTTLLKGPHQHVNRIFLANLKKHLLDWLKEVLLLAVMPANANPTQLPPLIDQDDIEHWTELGWLMFDNVVVIQDRHPHISLPNRPRRGNCSGGAFCADPLEVGFSDPTLADLFREAAYTRQLWPLPKQGNTDQSSSSIPRVVTVMLYPEDYPPVVNHQELVEMLENVTEPLGFKVSLACARSLLEFPWCLWLACMSY